MNLTAIDATISDALKEIVQATGLRKEILSLHRPHSDGTWLVCYGCDGGTEFHAEWPCQTYALVVDWPWR